MKLASGPKIGRYKDIQKVPQITHFAKQVSGIYLHQARPADLPGPAHLAPAPLPPPHTHRHIDGRRESLISWRHGQKGQPD